MRSRSNELTARRRTPYLIIGGGRMARHFKSYLSRLGLPFSAWARSEHPPERARPALEKLLADAPVESPVLLLISDRAIEPFFLEHRSRIGSRRSVHFSGALSIPGILAAHPLGSFGPDLDPLEIYRRIAFAIDPGTGPLDQILPGLKNRWFEVPAVERARYHALCVLGGNFTTLLWRKVASEFASRFGVTPEALVPYFDQVVENLRSELAAGRTGREALTGPLARGDRQTIARNLAALRGDPYQTVYRSFVEAFDRENDSGKELTC